MVEEAWNHHDKAPFEDFQKRLNNLDKRFSEYLSPVKLHTESLSFPEIEDGHQDEQTWFDDELEISLSTTRRDLDIRYSLDGSPVTEDSEKPEEPLLLKETTELRYRSFKNSKPVGAEMLEYFELHPLKIEMTGDFTIDPEERWDTPELHLVKFRNEVNIEISATREGEIKYITDGNELNAEAEKYTSPLKIIKDTFVKAGFFVNGKQVGKSWQQHFKKEQNE